MRRFVMSCLLFAVGFAVCVIDQSDAAYAGLSTSSESGSTISVGVSSDASSPGNTGITAGNSTIGGGSDTGGAASFVPVCTSTVLALNNDVGPPAGVTTPGSWYSIVCTTSSGGTTTTNPWIPNGSAPAIPAATPAVNPYALAMQAENSLQLPSPTINFNPATNAVVNLPTWLWIDPALWHPYVVNATVGTVTATATATPESVSYNLGDGDALTCPGPGTAYRTDQPSAEQQTSCSYAYPSTSSAQPSPDGNPNDGAFRVTATVTWQVSWSAQGAPGGGGLPSLTTSSATNLRVEQVESVNS
jgi:hypothetical protein